MYYVYVHRSKVKSNWIYVGYTSNLSRRIKQHNLKLNKSTKHYAPLVLESYIALSSRKKALLLEKYLKIGSGKAILRKRFLSDEALA